MKKLFGKLSNSDADLPITIVSGLPRSGTSMMMKMLEAGGMQVLTDSIRTADMDNPKGYYEFERVKALPDGDFEWLPEARGKAVKVIAALVPYLPSNFKYRIIFMRRSMPEVLASQRKMLINRGEDPGKINDEMITNIYEKHLKQVDAWMTKQTHLQRIEVNYNEMVVSPEQYITRVNAFLGGILDVQNMHNVIDPTLYRQRKAEA
jgi:hypothetical protein